MKAKQIALFLIPLNIILAYFVYNSINSELEFQKIAKVRIAENVQKLKDIIGDKVKTQILAGRQQVIIILNEHKHKNLVKLKLKEKLT